MSHINEFKKVLSLIEARDKAGRRLPLDSAIHKAAGLITAANRTDNKVILIGNGASAAIADHISADLVKNAGIASLTFNYASLLTCVSNDLGFARVFRKPLGVLAKKGDILFAISSSGKSENILSAAMEAGRRACSLITLSGFRKNNPLKKKGVLNFYVPSDLYGYVEISHLAVCHSIVLEVIRNIPHGQIRHR